MITTTMVGIGTAVLAADKFDPKQLAEQGVTADMQEQLKAAQGADVGFDQSRITDLIEQINIPLVLGVFLFYFICGYLLYSSLLAATDRPWIARRIPSNSCSRSRCP
ncbi:MAG: hypothetical protein IPL64_06460 [Flavobacteriales bacterium]|nr:hypothetical protein [Flavobacteriales bacterium]